jgi:hypothetical protein
MDEVDRVSHPVIQIKKTPASPAMKRSQQAYPSVTCREGLYTTGGAPKALNT